MAKVNFSRKEFEKHIKLTKDIEEKITMFGTHVESINQDTIELEILPNRPDLFSLQSFIRSFSAFLGKKSNRKYKVNKPEKDYEVIIDKNLNNIRPYTACAIVKNLKFDDEKIKEVIDLQEKIHITLGRNRKKIAIGIYPLEKIKLPIKFEARKPEDIKFIPLESNEEMSGLAILQHHPTGREYAKLLEGYDKFPVFVDANKKILSMPPVINSQETGKITLTTKDIFIECSGFDFDILKKTLNILITMFAEMGGERSKSDRDGSGVEIYQMRLKYSKQEITPNLETEKIKLNIENVNKLLGLNLKEVEMKKLLEKMEYEYENKNVLVPAWRTDVMHEVDIIEDIAIAYGYENFLPEIPSISTIGKESPKEIFKRKISELLVGAGFIEISSYHLLPKEFLKELCIKPKIIEVENSKTEYNILRPSLICTTLKTLSENIDSEYPQKIFEIGKVFLQNGYIEEENKLAVCQASLDSDFTKIKQILDYIARMLNLKFEIKEADENFLIKGRAGKILLNNKEIGIIGEVNPSVLKNLHIKMPVCILEISVDKI